MPEKGRQNPQITETVQNSPALEIDPFPKIRDYYGADILSAEQFDKENLEIIFSEADRIKTLIELYKTTDQLARHTLAALFYEPSTRTRLSFEAAMQKLGGFVISESSVQFSSIIKGEKLADTIRVVEGYADVIALRHPQEGSAKIAAQFAKVPIINAGDGPGEHPTQALLDLYTIKEKFTKIDGLSITFLGDLKFGRTVHSLATLLSHYKVKINFVAPQFLMMPDDKIKTLKEKGAEVETANKLEDLSDDYDALYVTRLQEERFADEQSAVLANLKGMYDLKEEFLEKTRAVIMHPLPRIDEIPMSIDENSRAIYFQQARNGLYIRMALLKLVLKGQ